MSRQIVFLIAALLSLNATAAEMDFDFSATPVNESPQGFRSILTGKGKPGEWKVITDEVPSLINAVTGAGGAKNNRHVLAQVSQDATGERFPLLMYDQGDYEDFTFTTRFKTVSGVMEQMAGIAFRIQDETNYYVVRASSLFNNLRFYKIVDGQRGTPIGPEVRIPSGVWHELSVTCQGNHIRCSLNGKEAIPPMTDNSFAHGKVAFWTKSDAVSYFVDAHLTYTPREIFAKALIRDTMKENPRLMGIKIYAATTNAAAGSPVEVKVIASKEDSDLGEAADNAVQDALARDVIYYARPKDSAMITMPLHDRNGEVVAVVRILLKPYFAENQQVQMARARPIVKAIESRIKSARDLFD